MKERPRHENLCDQLFGNGVGVEVDLRLEVCSLVFVDDVLLGQFVDHGDHRWNLFGNLFLILAGKEFLKRISHGFRVIAVAFALYLVLPYPLFSRFVICHFDADIKMVGKYTNNPLCGVKTVRNPVNCTGN